MRVVFIHGAFVRDGAWWWAPTASVLAKDGITSVAVALPSCGETGTAPTGSGPTLTDDAAAATAVLDQGGPAVVVALSYGGMGRHRLLTTRQSGTWSTSARSCRTSVTTSRHSPAPRTPCQSAVFSAEVTAVAWQNIPSTYLVCADDRSTSPTLQREHAARATHTVELPTGHHPFLSRPDLVAASIRNIASEG